VATHTRYVAWRVYAKIRGHILRVIHVVDCRMATYNVEWSGWRAGYITFSRLEMRTWRPHNDDEENPQHE
jgi:hypothetical protein